MNISDIADMTFCYVAFKESPEFFFQLRFDHTSDGSL